jgi:hypothetical protein
MLAWVAAIKIPAQELHDEVDDVFDSSHKLACVLGYRLGKRILIIVLDCRVVLALYRRSRSSRLQI